MKSDWYRALCKGRYSPKQYFDLIERILSSQWKVYSTVAEIKKQEYRRPQRYVYSLKYQLPCFLKKKLSNDAFASANDMFSASRC